MKKIAYLLASAVLILGLGAGPASAKGKVSGYLYRTTGLCSTGTTSSLDTSEIDRLSAVASGVAGTYAAVSFVDGAYSTAKITVSSNPFVTNSSPTLVINGTSVGYAYGASSQVTAANIANTINGDAVLKLIVKASTGTGVTGYGVVYATAIAAGVNAYSITSSSWAALTPSVSKFTGGVDSNVTNSSDLITKTNTFMLGQGVSLSTTTDVALGGLSWGTTYFVIPVQPGVSFKLATTAAGAVIGTAIDLTGSTAGGGSYTLTASSFTAGPNVGVWQASDDNSSWITLPTISSFTVNDAGAGYTGWDFGNVNYRYLRMNFTSAPTRGCGVIDISIEGKDYN